MKPSKRISICAILLACLCGTAGGAAAGQAVEPDTELLGLLAEDVRGVVHVDIARVLEVEEARALILNHPWLRMPGGYYDYVAETGVDPVSGLEQAMAGVRRPGDVIVVRVDFDTDLFEAFIQSVGRGSETYGAHAIYGSEDDPVGFAFAAGAAIVGPRAAVRGALDRISGGSSALDNAELMAAVAAVEAGFPVWGAGRFGDLIPADMVPPMAVDLVEGMGDVHFHVGVEDAFTARVTAAFASPEAALRAAELLRGFIALGAMGAAEAPDVAELLGGLRVVHRGDAVEMSLSANWELVDRVVRSFDVDVP